MSAPSASCCVLPSVRSWKNWIEICIDRLYGMMWWKLGRAATCIRMHASSVWCVRASLATQFDGFDLHQYEACAPNCDQTAVRFDAVHLFPPENGMQSKWHRSGGALNEIKNRFNNLFVSNLYRTLRQPWRSAEIYTHMLSTACAKWPMHPPRSAIASRSCEKCTLLAINTCLPDLDSCGVVRLPHTLTWTYTDDHSQPSSLHAHQPSTSHAHLLPSTWNVPVFTKHKVAHVWVCASERAPAKETDFVYCLSIAYGFLR